MPTDGEEVPFFSLTEFFCTVKYDLVLKKQVKAKKKKKGQEETLQVI